MLVTLATYFKSKTAYFLKERFEEQGIDCFFSFIFNTETRREEIRVQVKEEDVERAIQIMLGIKDEYGKDIEEIESIQPAKKILVPTDFSTVSENACHYAVQLARNLKAEIKLLHVYENPIADVKIKESATFEDYAKLALKEVETRAREGIVAFTQRIKEFKENNKLQDVRIHSSIVMGKTMARLHAISNIYHPDIVVLGIYGKGEESESTLAGIAEEIIRDSYVPVYAVPGSFSTAGIEKVNILYATDFNEKDHTSLNQLLRIVEPFEKSISCIHIDTAHNPSKKERMDELNVFLKDEYSQHEISCHLIEDQDVFHGIKSFADQNRINLLSFTTQKRGIFEKLFRPNLFKQVLQEANLPLLIFPS